MASSSLCFWYTIAGGLLSCDLVLVVGFIESFFVSELIFLERSRFDFDEPDDAAGEIEPVVKVVSVVVGDDNALFFLVFLGELFPDLGDERLFDEVGSDLRLDCFLILLSEALRLDDEVLRTAFVDDELFLEDELAEDGPFCGDEPFFDDEPDDLVPRDELRPADEGDFADPVDAERPRGLAL